MILARKPNGHRGYLRAVPRTVGNLVDFRRAGTGDVVSPLLPTTPQWAAGGIERHAGYLQSAFHFTDVF